MKKSSILTTCIFLTLSMVARGWTQSPEQRGEKPVPSLRADTLSADTTRVYHLDEVVITPTRNRTDISRVGRSVTLIDSPEMNDFPNGSFAELLGRHEGLYIVGAGQNPGMVQSIFLRGASTSQTIVMVDEVRIGDPSGVNNALDLSEVFLGGTDRIELTRGSHSTMYGSSAIGGTINIFTLEKANPGIHSGLEFGLGTSGSGSLSSTQKMTASYTAHNGLYAHLGIDHATSRGLDATIDATTAGAVAPFRDKDDFSRVGVFGKLGFSDERIGSYLSFRYNDQRADLDKGAFVDDDNYTLRYSRNLFTYGARYRLRDDLMIKYLGGYSAMRRFARDDSSRVVGSGTFDHTYYEGTWNGNTFTNELQVNLNRVDVSAVLGGGMYNETMGSHSFFYSAGSFGAYEFRTNLDTLGLGSTTINIFSHADIRGSLLNRSLSGLSLGAGSRVTHHDRFGTYVTYEINPSVEFDEGSIVYFSCSTGFNAPSLYQLYTPEKNYFSGIARGNSFLKPETSTSWELGAKYSLNDHTGFTVSLFHTDLDDVIENVYLWDGGITIDELGADPKRDDFRGDMYLNVGTQSTNGLEITFQSRLWENLRLGGNMSLIGGKLNYVPSELDPAQTRGNHVQLFSNGAFLDGEVETIGLVRRPNTVNLNLTYLISTSMNLRLDMRYVGPRDDIYYNPSLGPYGALATQPVDTYTLLDLSQGFTFDDNLRFQARIENLFNTRYAEIRGFTTRGRGLYLSSRLKL